MTSYKSNLIANFAGAGTGALLQLLFIPFYIRFLGIEAYGLIGFYVMLQAILQVLDLGLGPTMNREMARYSVSPGKKGEARDFAHTLGIVYWIFGIAAGAAIAFAAPGIAGRWIHADTLPAITIVHALMLMGGLAALQFPLAFYQGGLMGLQRQVLFNSIRVLMLALSSGGAVLVLWLVSPTITAFLAWQLMIAALQAVIFGRSLSLCLPPADAKPRFSPELLKDIRHFAAGMGGIAICSVILTQMDKILLSRLMPLKMFGYYSLAASIGGGIAILVSPVFNASFPRLSGMVASRNEDVIRILYHQAIQLVAALTLPVTAMLVFFPEEVLFAWTGNAETAGTAAPILRFLAAGSAVNALVVVPYALQIAYGWTRLSLLLSIGLIITMPPLIYAATLLHGAAGTASIWLLLNLIILFISLPLTHGRLLPGDSVARFLGDVAMPLFVSVLLMGIARAFLKVAPGQRLLAALELGGLLSVVFALTAAATPVLRTWMREQWRGIRCLHVDPRS